MPLKTITIDFQVERKVRNPNVGNIPCIVQVSPGPKRSISPRSPMAGHLAIVYVLINTWALRGAEKCSDHVASLDIFQR